MSEVCLNSQASVSSWLRTSFKAAPWAVSAWAASVSLRADSAFSCSSGALRILANVCSRAAVLRSIALMVLTLSDSLNTLDASSQIPVRADAALLPANTVGVEAAALLPAAGAGVGVVGAGVGVGAT